MSGSGIATKGGYRREIDGLRAIAVLAVMLYHAGFPNFGGGFLGVDIFFVISGYLITGIILRDADAGRFRLRHFIERRVRRIFPALATVLLTTVPLAFVFLTPDALEGYASSLAATTLFGGNLYFWRMTGGYFGLTTPFMPLLHLWSLSLEEQFYLLFPPAVLLLLRMGRRWLLPGLALLAMASLTLCWDAATRAPAANFFLLPMRAWELLAGALVVAGERRWPPRSSRTRDLAAWLCLLLALAPVPWLNDESRFPWPWALPTVLGVAGFLRWGREGHGPGRWLGTRLPVGLGLVSYSAYLWHQPILAFARLILPRTPGTVGSALLLLLAVGLAALTWRFVEKPYRDLRTVSSTRLWSIFVGVSVSVLAVALFGKLSHGLPARFAPEQRVLATMTPRMATAIETCLSPISAQAPPEPPCRVGVGGPVTVAVLGDSHAATLAPALHDIVAPQRERAVIWSHAGCPPVLDSAVLRPAQASCGAYNRRLLAQLAGNRTVATVLLAARWTYYLERRWFDNGEGGVELGPREAPTTAAERAEIVGALRWMVRQLLASGKRVIVVYPEPEPGWNVPMLMFRQDRLGGRWIDGSVSWNGFATRNRPTYAALDSIGRHPRLLRLYPADRLCNRTRTGRCATMAGPTPLFFDDDHLSPAGARRVLKGLPGLLPASPRPTDRFP